ncbi:hypothetical protein BGZ96_006374, partial [Linnemannia gamsii]
MADDCQSFRQGVCGDVFDIEVSFDPETNQQVIYWSDITLVFPNARFVKKGNTVVTFVRDAQREWCAPSRIKHYPGAILDVVDCDISRGDPQSPSTPEPTANLSTPTSLPPTMLLSPSSTAFSFAPDKFLDDDECTYPTLKLESLALHETITGSTTFASNTSAVSSTPTSLRLFQRTQSMLQESSVQLTRYESSIQAGEVAHADAIMHGMQAMHRDLHGGMIALHSEVTKNKELQLQILNMQSEADTLTRRMEEMQKYSIELQERSIKMQQEALDRLALIQNKVAAIMTQSYELHEYPIPRLFIVLPKEDATRTETLGRGIKNLFAKQFKLYFLCECGDHTKPVGGRPTNPNLKHEIHIARHEGYDIDRPTEFFETYGSYILTLLQMLKYGVAIAGVVVPPLGQLKIVDSLDGVAEGIDHVLKDIGSQVDSSIAYIEGLAGAQSQLESSSSNSPLVSLGGLEALEGADLRQLESFLKTKDEGRVLGNLYRIVTSDGHVKWVCIDHYRENYRAKAAQDLRDAVQGASGEYDEITGSVRVKFFTPIAARNFYSVLAYSRSVQCLELTFLWSPSIQDLRDLRDTIKSTNVVDITLKKNTLS